MFRKQIFIFFFCVVFAVPVMPCMGDDGGSGSSIGDFVSGIGGGIGDVVSSVGSGIAGASGDLVSMPDILGAGGDLTSMLSSGLESLMNTSSLPSIGNAGDFPLVGPNVGYKRVLWLFSGESSINSIKAVFSGVINGIQSIAGDLKESLRQFGND